MGTAQVTEVTGIRVHQFSNGCVQVSGEIVGGTVVIALNDVYRNGAPSGVHGFTVGEQKRIQKAVDRVVEDLTEVLNESNQRIADGEKT